MVCGKMSSRGAKGLKVLKKQNARRGENNGKKTPGTEEVPDEAPVKIMVAQFLDVVGDSVTIEKALFYLKKKDFDIEAAISLYLTTQSTRQAKSSI